MSLWGDLKMFFVQRKQVEAAKQIVKEEKEKRTNSYNMSDEEFRERLKIQHDDFISDLKQYRPDYFSETHEHLMFAKDSFLQASSGCEYRSVSSVGILEKKEIDVCNHKEMDAEYNPSFLCNMRDCPILFNFIMGEIKE